MRSSRLTAFCTARIHSADESGDVFTFSILPTGEAGEVHVPFMTGASIDINMGGLAKTTVTFDAPYEEGIKLLESGAFAAGNILEVEMGYHGSPERSGQKFGMIIDAQTGIQIVPEGVSGTISANIAPVPARFREPSAALTSAWDGSPFADFLPDIIRHKAKNAGYSKVVFTGSSEALVADNSLLFGSGGAIGLYDILSRLRNVSRLTWRSQVVDGGYELEIYDYATMSALRPSRLFVMRGGLFESQGNVNTYPIISLSPDIQGFTFSTAPAKVSQGDVGRDGTVDIQDSTPGESDEKTGAPEGENNQAIPAKRGDAIVNREQGEQETSMYVENPNAEGSFSAAKNVVQAKNTLKMSLVTVGLPSLPLGREDEVVEVKGVGIFNGDYQVNTAVHTWSGSGIDTNLTLFRNKVKGDAGVNDQTVEP